MRRLFDILFIAMLLSLAACQQVEQLVEPEVVSGPAFTAQIETFDAETKTALANGNSVVWSVDDQISIFQGTVKADTYQVDEKCVGTTEGRFGIVAKGESSADTGFDANIAMYPYQAGLTVTPVVEDGQPAAYQITGVTIPSVQTYTANTFANGSFLMAAVTKGIEDHTLSFKNLCGALKLQLKGTCKVKTICLQGNDGEPLSGDATVTISSNSSMPTLIMSENASAMVSVNWIDGVQLNSETATSFFITVPPTSFEKGFTVKIVDIMGAEAVIQTSKANAVVRSYVHTMPEITIETVYPSVDVNALSGLSIACIGDSITQGVGAEGKPYPSQLATRLNATVKNLGVSGSSLCEGGARTCNIGQLTEANCAGKDIVTILMGVNDWAAARNNASEGVYYHLGDINTRETNTIRGAMRMWCDKIQELRTTESCANTRFYFMTPTITSWNSSVTKTRDWDQSKTNIHGFTLRDLCHAIIDVATEYDIPVIDLNICSGIYYNSPEDENVSLYGGDGVHINGAGHTLVTDAIIRALASDMTEDETESIYGLITQLTPGMTYHPGQVSGPKGTLNVNSDYNSWSYTVPNDCKIFAGYDDKLQYGYLSMSVVPTGASSGVRYRCYSSEDTLPTKENPLEVGAGSTVYVSVRKNVINWAFYTTDVKAASEGLDIMDAVVSNHLILRNTFITDEIQNLLVLKKCVGNDELFLGQNFMKIVDDAINSNCWRLGTLDMYKRIGNEFVVCESGIIISGEWECAIKESGAADFMGGNAHGDEQILDITATLDGKPLDLSSSFVATGASLDIVRHSILNRCHVPGDNVIDHTVSYSITPESITIDQTAEWLQDMVVESSYLLMCPISRAYITSAMIEGQNEVVDISYAGHSRPSLSGNKGHFSLWGDKFTAEIEYECIEGAFDGAFSFISPSSSPAYNKFYYNFVGSNVQQPVTAGHKVITHGEIIYSYFAE